MGGSTPKQFLRMGGKSILRRTIERFIEADPAIKVITVLPERYLSEWKYTCVRENFDCPQILVPGGLTRFHSVRNALTRVPDGAVAAIHDGVRPFVSPALISKMFGMMDGETRALIPVLPVTDTLRSTDSSLPDPDRSKIVAVQTPQLFLSEDIRQAYAQAYSTAFTDDASVAAAAGIEVKTVEGERLNIKITTPEDIALGEAIISLQRF